MLGCHLEGPFVSPERPGALDVRHLRAPDRAELGRLLDAGGGSVQMIVVAPELPRRARPRSRRRRPRASSSRIGHTDATYAEATAGFDRGARAATHLFNGDAPASTTASPAPAGAALVRRRA